MTTSLFDRYQALKASQPSLRQRDAADALGVSEGEIVTCLPQTVRLNLSATELVKRLEGFGQLKAITRNAAAVHEKDGEYTNLSLGETMGLALNPDGLDLRFFFKHWVNLFALKLVTPRGVQHSIQVYDEFGDAVHKLFLGEHSKLEAWEALVAEFGTASQELTPAKADAAKSDAADVDLSTFHADWLALQDVHHFHGMLKRHGVSRRRAFELAPEGYSWKLDASATETLLNQAAEAQLPIMVFVGNRGLVQIHTGKLQRIKRVDDWINILDPGFNLHLLETLVDQIWLVRRPIVDGMLTAVELFDKEGNTLATFFGERREGQLENPAWTALATALPAQEARNAA
ncbi:hemin-degrading factor [Neisseriaceae bacterium JH1-16]|nr:hemin-degrading factor [Neisseriaceae bacterium JH1-16]